MKRIHIFDHGAYHQSLIHQVGNGLPVFAGYRQHGAGLGNILGIIGRYVLLLFARHVIPHAKSAIPNTISDVVKGKSLGEAFQANGSSMLRNLGSSLLQTGEGLDHINTVGSENISSVIEEPLSMPCQKRKRKSKKRSIKKNGLIKVQAKKN